MRTRSGSTDPFPRGTTAQDVIDDFGSISGGNAVFNFGGGHVLTVAGVTNLSSLVDDIFIV